MFTATNAASATMDFTKDSVDDGVVDSPPSRGPIRTPVCSPSPLKRLCTSPSRRRSMSPTLPSCKTPQRPLYPMLHSPDSPELVTTTSPLVMNPGGVTIPAQPRNEALNNCGTKTTRSLGGVSRQPIARGIPLSQSKSVRTRPPPSRRASCTLRPYPAPDVFASPLPSRPSRSLDSLRRREREGFDTWLARRSETVGTTSYMVNSRRNDLIRGLMKQQEANARLLEKSSKLNDST
ncbi:hypothetical protein KC19_VG314000 [Ceratodon purpureus]|uniref:Uncharacterized protein n=1 Tax=Ceratodon purpureus TaxID=3225 RepID=A0A8T0HWK7_CERPU|nr:hypothetical protein KC19_VG314000 [Ceratodon purpureus]